MYLLGAGFSAPLGLPVIATFLDRAKEQYLRDQTQYAHFKQVFEAIKEISACKRYTNLDLENIEDILSLVEMSQSVGSPANSPDYVRFIRDVIAHYTPADESTTRGEDWIRTTFAPGPWGLYAAFAAALHRVHLGRANDDRLPDAFVYSHNPNTEYPTRYAVITLNYDIVLERSAALVSRSIGLALDFHRPSADKPLSENSSTVPLVKLHGSMEGGPLVPPTWSKGLSDKNIREQWRAAYHLLRDAQDIRILGYSLPDNDAYVRFLIRAALMDSIVLQNIDVLCLDDQSKSVQTRYRTFFNYSKLRFHPTRIEKYLNSLTHAQWPWVAKFGPEDLERTHSAMFPPPNQ